MNKGCCKNSKIVFMKKYGLYDNRENISISIIYLVQKLAAGNFGFFNLLFKNILLILFLYFVF